MSDEKENAKNKPRARRWMVLVWALAFFVILDVGTRIYFSRPGIVVRNIDRGIGSLPYLFSQMDKHKGPKVAFVGASVMQGYQNVSPDRAFPALVEKRLSKSSKHKNVKCFNLASAGHNFGDHYSIASEAIRHKPDLIVVAIHFKSFSQHPSTSVPIQHKSLSAYIYDDPKRNELLKRWGVKKSEFWKYRIDGFAKNISAFYRYNQLMTQLATASSDPPSYAISNKYRQIMGFPVDAKSAIRDLDPEDRSTDYLWKLLPEALIGHNHEIGANLDYSDSNINWRTFVDLCELGAQKKVNMLFYISPINRTIVLEHNFFDLGKIRGLQHAVIQNVTGNGHLLADASARVVDDAFFSDTDHMNMNGHAQLAIRMASEVSKGLKRGKWKPSRLKRMRY